MKIIKFIKYPLPLVVLAGCATTTTQESLDEGQDEAIQTVLSRAKFEMNCQEAQGLVLSRQYLEPVINSPRFGGIDRYQYTIGVEGCGQRKTYVVICREGGDGCFAADGRR